MSSETKTILSPGPIGQIDEAEHADPLGRDDDINSREIPPGVDRRTFLMRSAVVSAAMVITGNPMSAQEAVKRSTATTPADRGPAEHRSESKRREKE